MHNNKKLSAKATRNGFTGKLEVWRDHGAESAKTVPSLVKISAGDQLGRIAQIRHFLDFVAEKAIEVATVTLFTNKVQTDVDCGLSWVDTSNMANKTFLLAIYQGHWLLLLMIQLIMFCGCLILTMCRMLLIVFND